MRKLEFFRKPVILILLTVLILSGCKPRPEGEQQDRVDSFRIIEEQAIQVAEESRGIPCAKEDSLALVAFFHATGGEEWVDPWTFDDPVYYWEGITLSEEGRVTKISLPDFNIQGFLPEELGTMTELKVLNLENNTVTGEIMLLDYIYFDNAYYSWNYYNIFEENFEEDQLNWYTAYVYHPEGLEIYASPEISDENSVGNFGQGEAVYLFEPLNADPNDMFEIDGHIGCMRPLDLGYDTAWIFSGYLCKLPFPDVTGQSYFYENIRLLNTLRVERGYTMQDGELSTNDEEYGLKDFSRFEHGISVSESMGYAGGGTSIEFDEEYFDIQDVYLFADALMEGAFSEKFGFSLPDAALNDTMIISEETMEILTVVINEEYGYPEEISISLEDTGYFEELSLVVEDGFIVLSWGGGG